LRALLFLVLEDGGSEIVILNFFEISNELMSIGFQVKIQLHLQLILGHLALQRLSQETPNVESIELP